MMATRPAHAMRRLLLPQMPRAVEPGGCEGEGTSVSCACLGVSEHEDGLQNATEEGVEMRVSRGALASLGIPL